MTAWFQSADGTYYYCTYVRVRTSWGVSVSGRSRPTIESNEPRQMFPHVDGVMSDRVSYVVRRGGASHDTYVHAHTRCVHPNPILYMPSGFRRTIRLMLSAWLINLPAHVCTCMQIYCRELGGACMSAHARTGTNTKTRGWCGTLSHGPWYGTCTYCTC